MSFFDFHWFTDLFNSAEKAWHKLEPQVQNALIHGSGVVKVINDNLQATPQVIFDLIDKKFPDLTKENLTAGLAKVSASFGIAEAVDSPDILTLIQNLQKYFSGLKGKFWEAAASTISQVLAIALAPDETPMAKIVQLIEFVFRKKLP
jgi:hypothetical protein